MCKATLLSVAWPFNRSIFFVLQEVIHQKLYNLKVLELNNVVMMHALQQLYLGQQVLRGRFVQTGFENTFYSHNISCPALERRGS